MTHFESVIQRLVGDVERYLNGELRGDVGLNYVQTAIDGAVGALDVSEAPKDFLDMMARVPDSLENAWYTSIRAQDQVNAILEEFLHALQQKLTGTDSESEAC